MERHTSSEVWRHSGPVDKRALVPWYICDPKDRTWQEQRVRELGYCPYCENLDFEIINDFSESGEYRGWPDPQLKAVLQAAEEGCQSCDLLCRVIRDFNLASNFQDETDALYVRSQVESARFAVSVWVNLDKWSESVQISRRCEVQGPAWTALPLVHHIVPDNLGDQSCLNMVGQWLGECLEQHEVDPLPAPQLPSRVIEIVGKGVVRLVRTDGRRGHYLALSHHWSSDPQFQPTQTKQGNIQRHSEGIQISTLTKTLREAIQLTSILGYQFLWIDSLCIVQDDQDDWARESGKMSEVFGCSTLTIFAATPLGCFVHRHGLVAAKDDPSEVDRLYFQSKNYICRSNSGMDVDIIAHSALHHTRVSGLQATILSNAGPEHRYLFERGWVLQEWALSPRAVVFDRDEIFWACDHVERCECQHGIRRQNTSRSSPLGVRRGFREKPAEGNIENTIWFGIIEAYSRASLSFESDRLPALSGLAKAFARVFWAANFDSKFTNYLAGCWREQILPSLLWHENRSLQGTYVKYPDSKRQSGYSVPSWSWAEALAGVQFHLLADMKRTQYVTSVESGYCRPATSDPTGAVENAHLIAWGPTFEIDLDLTITQSVKRPDVDVEAETLVELDLQANTYSRLIGTTQRSVRATFLLLGCCVDLELRYWERGIIIVPSQQHPGSYERLGFFEARGRSELYLPPPYDDDGNLGHIDWKEYDDAEARDKEEWCRRAYGVHLGRVRPGDQYDDVNVDGFVERLRNGDVDEVVKRKTLLPQCTIKRVTIV